MTVGQLNGVVMTTAGYETRRPIAVLETGLFSELGATGPYSSFDSISAGDRRRPHSYLLKNCHSQHCPDVTLLLGIAPRQREERKRRVVRDEKEKRMEASRQTVD